VNRYSVPRLCVTDMKNIITHNLNQGRCGQLGHGNRENVLHPKIVEAFDGIRITFVRNLEPVSCCFLFPSYMFSKQAAGGGGLGCSHSVGLTEDGVCYAWYMLFMP